MDRLLAPDARAVAVGDADGWQARLTSAGPEREAAVEELHALLLRAARFEIHRRWEGPRLPGDEREDLAQQAADDALVSILARLEDFRRLSRFTTWAYKFALYEAAAAMRRRAWRGREVSFDSDVLALFADRRAGPDTDAEMRELLAALRESIDGELTPHQREVLVALPLNDVPIDVLAARLSTTRGALYKTLHDARRKLRAALAARGVAAVPPTRGAL
jgi:RNA polymerase sigma-70 factor (ECF subfamily)